MIQKLMFVAMLFAGNAMAAPISCGNTQSPYRVLVSSDHKTAELTVKGKIPQFGKLVCRSGKRLVCSSPRVADAGYQTTFTPKPGSLDLIVQVDEFWFGGTRLLVNLPCVQAQ